MKNCSMKVAKTFFEEMTVAKIILSQNIYNFQLLHNRAYFSLSTVVLFKLMAIFWKTAIILRI